MTMLYWSTAVKSSVITKRCAKNEGARILQASHRHHSSTVILYDLITSASLFTNGFYQ